MAKVGAQRAAELTGKSKSTIQRAMNSGKLSYEIDSNNRRIIDVSELERVFGLKSQEPTQNTSQAAIEAELKKAADMIEMERMKMKIKTLEDQLHVAENSIEDLKGQRDQWQKQAQQVLITSQYSQKQAEDLKAELKEREERARKRREQMLAERMKRMEAQNQNQAQEEQAEENFVSSFFRKIKGEKAA
ncbi:MAG: entry exclusion 1 domain-containing protein [Pseudomonadota bacterium]